MLHKVRKLALTYRLYFIPVVYITLVFGYISAGSGISGKEYLYFFLVAISAHFFGFGVNDWSDLEYDKTNPRHIKRSMLVRGELKLSWHQIITLVQFPILVAWAFVLDAKFESVLLAAISIMLLTVYNLLGKKSDSMVILVDTCFPLSMVFLFLTGFSLSEPLSELDPPLVLLLITLFLSLTVANSIQAGFRDLKADFNKGASNFLEALGSTHSDRQLKLNQTTKVLSYTVYLTILPLIIIQAVLNDSPWWYFVLIVVLISYGFMDLVVMLNRKTTEGLQLTDYYVATAYTFYAALLPWMHLLPKFLWAVVILNLLYPFLVRNKTHFGFQTFTKFGELIGG